MATRKIGRSAVSGQFVPVKKAETEKRNHVVETIKPTKSPKKPAR